MTARPGGLASGTGQSGDGGFFALLSELTACLAPAGHERAVAEYVAERLPDVRQDSLGNVVTTLGRPNAPNKLLLAAHMDEVGLVVSYIAPTGLLYALPLGLVAPEVVSGTQVTVLTAAGPVGAAALAAPAHLRDLSAVQAHAGVWLDCGASCEADARELVAPGDPATFVSPLRRIGSRRVTGKALDNRIGCAILLELARRLEPGDEWCIAAAFTVQEETGARGAEAVARAEAATLAIVLDTVSASDANVSPPTTTVELGAGPTIRAADVFSAGGAMNTRGTFYSAPLRRLALKRAAELSIPVQQEVFRTWTDAGQISSSNGFGIPTLGVFVPRRGSHSPAEVVDLADVEYAARLVEGLVDAITTTDPRELASPW